MPQSLASIVRFLIAGGSGTALYFALLYGLTEYANLWYLASAVIAFVIASSWNFLLHKFWTFRNADRIRMRKQARDYGILVSSMFVANTGALYALVEYAGLWYMFAQVIVTAIITIVSFLVSRRIFS